MLDANAAYTPPMPAGPTHLMVNPDHHDVDVRDRVHVRQPLVHAAQHVCVRDHGRPWRHGAARRVGAVDGDGEVAARAQQRYVLKQHFHSAGHIVVRQNVGDAQGPAGRK
jgi:hypothetical protein